MSIAEFNARWEIEVTAYNESLPTRGVGGTVERELGESVILNVLQMHIPNTRENRDKNGRRFKVDGFKFQVSDVELTEKNFEIITGRTFIEKNGYKYRVTEVKDYRNYKFTLAMQCLAVRMIPVNAN